MAIAAKHASSSGHGLAAAAWLDTHYEACRDEYEAMVRSVGLQPGWHVLDAGTGSGSFLPALAELVGPSGAVTALDAAPENVALVEERIASAPLACPIDVREGSVAALPWSDASFDAVWCANVLQYFSDQELPGVITELRRVVRPGGLVAVKDVDMTLFRFHPADPFLVTHLSEASIRAGGAAWSEGSLRARTLRRHLEAGGLSDVWQRTTLIERWAPLAPAERRLWTEWLAFLATLAEERGVPDADLPTWRALRDAEASPSPVDQPDFYACEGQVLAVGIR